MSKEETQVSKNARPSIEWPAVPSPILINLVTRRSLEPLFKKEILRAVQGLPIEAKTFRFIEAMDWFFGSRRFGYLLIRNLLDKLLPDVKEFYFAFCALGARVIQDTLPRFERLLTSGPENPAKGLKLQLSPREEDPAWSALVSAVHAYAQKQTEAEPAINTRTPSMEALMLNIQKSNRDRQPWSIHQFRQSPVGQEFSRRLRDWIYNALQVSILDQLNHTPTRVRRLQRRDSTPSAEEVAAETAEQAELYQKHMRSYFGPEQVAALTTGALVTDIGADQAQECCADLILLFVWRGLLDAPSPI